MPRSLYLIFPIVFLFYNSSIHAQITNDAIQNHKADSLIQELLKAKVDTSKVTILVELSDELTYTKEAEGRAYGYQALDLAISINFQKGIAEAIYCLGYYDIEKHEYLSAKEKFLKAISIFKSINRTKDLIYSYFALGIAREYLNNLDSAVMTYQEALNISTKHGNEKIIAHANYYLGGAYHTIGNHEMALKYMLIAHEYYDSHHLLEDEWYALNLLSIIHNHMGMYPESLSYNLNALEVTQALKEKKWEIVTSNNIAVLYTEMENNDEAIGYYESALESSRVIGDTDMESSLLGNIAGLKVEQGDTVTALNYNRQALAIQLKDGYNCSSAYTYEGIGDIYVGKNILDSALFYFSKAQNVSEECNDYALNSSIQRNLGIVYKQMKNYAVSKKYLDKALKIAKKYKLKSLEMEAHLELYHLYKELNNKSKALHSFELRQSIRDSIYNLNNSEKVNRLTAEFKFKKERRLLELENEKRLLAREAQIENQTQIRNGALVMLFMIAIFFIILYQSYTYIKMQNIKLRKMNVEKNTLMGVVAHDLRNPLNNIKTILPILKENSPEANESKLELVGMMEETTERMYGMIERILDVNAVEEMKIRLNMKVVDLGITISKICHNFDIPAKQKGIEFQCDVVENNHFARVDENYLIQIVENLISNALKFSPNNAHVFLRLEKSKEFENIVIRDEGPGISKEEQEKLFKKYGKISNKPTAGESSTGLGLSIVKRYVNAMDGTIFCESKQGEGATFTVAFKSI